MSIMLFLLQSFGQFDGSLPSRYPSHWIIFANVLLSFATMDLAMLGHQNAPGSVCCRLLVSVGVCWCLLVSVGVCWCLLVSCVVCRCLWGVYVVAQGYLNGICGCLGFSDVFGSYLSTESLQNGAKYAILGQP